MLDDEEIKRLRMLCEDATPTPWTTQHGVTIVVNSVIEDVIVGSTRWTKDAAFIAAARTALPALLDEVEAWKSSAEAYAATVTAKSQEAEALRAQLARAASENFAFNVKAAQQINEARAERDRMRPVVEAAVAFQREEVSRGDLLNAVDAFRLATGASKAGES